MGNSNMLKERNPKACLTKGSYAGYHTRWRGLESHLFHSIPGNISRLPCHPIHIGYTFHRKNEEEISFTSVWMILAHWFLGFPGKTSFLIGFSWNPGKNIFFYWF